ncbi:transcriptional regulator [Deinococcus aetherius]|uniref:Transcriptional regulator n=1 Tax=Deinococcus aetherius TaxID=200252 RepID=A0ABM8AFI5_9DEIO|nr:AraC family transcriptional regulator [Deinococcus aetherius]BDP42416.1 transcriptional regulator [Deinococcus aetherius]
MRADETATFTRPRELPGVETLTARYITHRFLPHTHEALVLGVIEGGAESFRFRGGRVVAPAGSVVVVPPGEVHTGEAAGPQGWAYRVLYLGEGWLTEAGVAGAVGFGAASLHDPDLAARVRRAHAALTSPGASPLARETLLREALGHLAARHADTRPRPLPSILAPDAVREARAYLDAHPETAVTLSGLAARVGLSPAHLARSFRAALGVPPHTYQMAARVRLARKLLDAGEAPADAALRAGFADQAHLTRVFKRVVGVPPGTYRRGR